MWLASAWLQGGDGPESRCSENDDMLLGREKLNIDGHSKDFFLAISCARLQESKLSFLRTTSGVKTKRTRRLCFSSAQVCAVA
jgi:hypothetical protein